MGGWASDMLSKRSGGGWASQMLGQRNAAAADDGFRSITDPAAELGPEHVVAGDTAGAPQWSGGSTLGDAAYSAAGGVLQGVGINPSMLGDNVAASLQMARERSPYASGVGDFLGEAAIQTAAAPAALARAPVAMGAISGALSGLGNSEGSFDDRARAAAGGAAGGAFGSALISGATGKLSSLLERKGAEYGEQQAIHGLMNRGAQADDLTRLDKLGGVQQFYDDANRLGITGKPQQAAVAARQVAQNAEATRAAIEARNAGVQVDPVAAAAAVRGANPYPGVPRMDRAAQRAAQGVQEAGPSFGAMDTQRAYYGNASNFASGSPNQVMGQRIHGAINNELEDAINLAEPGAGSLWRQAGRDERTGIELGNIAQKALYRGAARPFDAGDIWTGGLKPLLNNNRHGIQESLYGTGAALARGGAAIGDTFAGLPAAATGAFAGNEAANAPTPAQQSQAALDMLYSGGGDLGAYKSQFAEAAGSPNPGAVQDLITRLTLSDPQFRTQLLPLLSRRSGGM